jgi:phosphoribosylformylglycinamidine cyclo-ligase
MEYYVPEEVADQLISISESFGIPAQRIGRVEASDSKSLTIKSAFGQFDYR